MSIVINGSGSISGISAGGLPDGCITADDIGSLPAGSVLQVVSNLDATYLTTTSTSYVDTSLSVAITPSNTSSKILILTYIQVFGAETSGLSTLGMVQLVRNATSLTGDVQYRSYDYGGSGAQISLPVSLSYLDSPSSTESLTYKIQIKLVDGDSVRVNSDSMKSSIIAMEIAG